LEIDAVREMDIPVRVAAELGDAVIVGAIVYG